MRNLRKKLAVGVLVAVCLNFVALQVAFAFSDEDLDKAVQNVDKNPISQQQQAQAAVDQKAIDDQAAKESSRGTLLPNASKNYQSVEECKALMNELSTIPSVERKKFFQEDNVISTQPFTQNDILACGIKTGSIGLWMVPYYIRYVLEFAIQMAGLVAVGGIVYGGYLYLFAGVSDEKDKGKKAIMYSVAGMIMTMIAWALVNIVIGFLTG